MLVDYRCGSCGGRTEHWVRRPVPAQQKCPACHERSDRVFGFGAVGRGASPVAPQSASVGGCLRDAGVPGICHLHPSAARRWSAMARGDDAAVRREIRYQEAAIDAGTICPSDAVTVHHAAPAVSSESTSG